MKKLFALLLALVMVLSLAACGGGDDDKTPSNDDKTPSSSQQQEQEDKTPEADPVEDEPEETDPVETDPIVQDAPQSLDIPVDQYPFLSSLVLPDDGAVTSIDDAISDISSLESVPRFKERGE